MGSGLGQPLTANAHGTGGTAGLSGPHFRPGLPQMSRRSQVARGRTMKSKHLGVAAQVEEQPMAHARPDQPGVFDGHARRSGRGARLVGPTGGRVGAWGEEHPDRW